MTETVPVLNQPTQIMRLPRMLLDSGRWGILLLLVVLLILRVGYLLICPLDLVPDEAYYWDWSRQLDWSYYSKPPMIAWLIAFSTFIGGDTEFAIRFPAALMGTLGLWPVYELGRSMYDHRIGLWAFLIVAASPGMTVLCLLMTIDAPFLVAWTASLYCLWRLFAAEQPVLKWLVPAILATGVGLLTKQSAMGLIPLMMLFLLTGKSDRPRFKTAALWLWICGSLAFLLPVIFWNNHHSWVTLEHTSRHFGSQPVSALRHVTRFLEFIASQFGILSPLVCWMMLVVVATVLVMLPRLERRERFLLCFGGIPLIAVTALSLFQQVQPNWAIALHLPGLILLAAWGGGALPLSLRLDAWRKWLPTFVGFSAVMSVGVAIAPFVIPNSSVAGTAFDPTFRLRGWRDLGQQVATIMQNLPQHEDVLVIAATSRGPVSELAYYLPGKPRVYRWNVGQVVDSQHDLWSGPSDAHKLDAVIITDGVAKVPKRLAQSFSSVTEIGPVHVSLGSRKSRHYRIWRGESFEAWPDRLTPPQRLANHQDPILP
ncbi:MAG: glycosyl transferase family 39 [Schlesneria sp.]|nr:glycosyl transferase family 39 [Schlesneria sp.]